jgi:hypothetical protein
MRITRRCCQSFVTLVASALLVASAHPAEISPPVLPWQREIPLREAAKAAKITATLDPQQPTQTANVSRLTLSNLQLRSSLWGPSNRPTLSLLKTDVWDRRYGIAPIVTLAEIRAGAYSPANRGFDDMPPNQRRPVRGWLPPDGSGREDRYACWNAYPFPCQKPVGQIILGLDELAGVPDPTLEQSCADGGVRFHLKNERASADLTIVLSMTSNVYAIHGQLRGVGTPWLRLYRHEDQAWHRYMNDDRKTFHERTPGAASGAMPVGEVLPSQVKFDYAKDATWNGPIEPPTSGTDGTYFWIHQRFPAEKTFPQGFDYVVMGRVVGTGKPAIETKNNEHGLGTPPFGVRDEVRQRLEDGYKPIREAAGAAATAALTPDADGNITAYVTVVTCNDAADLFAAARRQLDLAVAAGFEKLVADNAAWYARLYDRRENGRVFVGNSGQNATENLPDVFSSWSIRHGGSNKPDMRRFEATASYANVEQDWQLWHSLPCYNEIFYEPTAVRNRGDSLDMWWQLIEAWHDAARANAREVYGVPEGMALIHGYLPPVKPDRYVHTSVALEYCIDTMPQMVKALWDVWDYGADEAMLREKTYPALRDTALFFMHYATLGADGRYHFIPAIEAEAWGIFPEFFRGQDTISALATARWTFLRAAEAAELLHTDSELQKRWLDMAGKLAAYPTYNAPNGTIFNSVPGTVPGWKPGDHGWYIGFYPTTLTDDINLDSPEPLRAEMIRTVAAVPSSRGRETLMLLGASRRENEQRANRGGPSGPAPEALLNSRSGRIHLFPAIGAGETIAFRRFQARGGFLVSAARDQTGVTFVEIESRRDLPCALMNPWPGKRVIVRDTTTGESVAAKSDDTNGDCLIFGTKAGGQYQLALEIPNAK